MRQRLIGLTDKGAVATFAVHWIPCLLAFAGPSKKFGLTTLLKPLGAWVRQCLQVDASTGFDQTHRNDPHMSVEGEFGSDLQPGTEYQLQQVLTRLK